MNSFFLSAASSNVYCINDGSSNVCGCGGEVADKGTGESGASMAGVP